MFIGLELLIIGLTLLIVGFPLLSKKGDKFSLISAEDERKADLLHKKENAFLSIQELENDYTSGKLSENDYYELKNKFEKEAIEILQELDGKVIAKEKPEEGNISTEGTEVLFCRSCGSGISNNDKFCFNCGEKIG